MNFGKGRFNLQWRNCSRWRSCLYSFGRFAAWPECIHYLASFIPTSLTAQVDSLLVVRQVSIRFCQEYDKVYPAWFETLDWPQVLQHGLERWTDWRYGRGGQYGLIEDKELWDSQKMDGSPESFWAFISFTIPAMSSKIVVETSWIMASASIWTSAIPLVTPLKQQRAMVRSCTVKLWQLGMMHGTGSPLKRPYANRKSQKTSSICVRSLACRWTDLGWECSLSGLDPW